MIQVYTDLPETALLMAQFNSSQSEYTAEITFIDTLGNKEETPKGDLLLAKDIHSTSYFRQMANLNALRETPYMKGVYPELLLACIYEKELKLIPLSVDLPLVISEKENLRRDSKTISWKEFTKSSTPFNQAADGSLTRVGFSPFWSDDFLANFLASGSRDFRLFLEHPGDRYESKTAQLIQWETENNGGAERIIQFADKYMYIPSYRLLMDHRIGFTMMRLSEYMLLPDEITKELSFRLYTMEERIQPHQIVSAGIFSDSPNPEGARVLAEWLLQEETWKIYYSEILQNKDGIFGLDGLSANYQINETLLSRIYPSLKGNLPYPGEFERIVMPVSQWTRVREEVLIPHTREVLSGTAAPEALTERYRKWQLLNPDSLSE